MVGGIGVGAELHHAEGYGRRWRQQHEIGERAGERIDQAGRCFLTARGGG